MKDLDMNARFRPKDANTHYEELEQYSVTRTKEISGMSAPYITLKLLTGVAVWFLGSYFCWGQSNRTAFKML